MSYTLTIIGLLLFANGFFMLMFANLTLGVILTALLGAFLFIWGIFYKKINAFTQKGIPKYIKNAVIVLFCLEAILVGFIAIYSIHDNVTYDEDAVIVLGAGIRGDKVTLPLKYRLDRALEYQKKNPDALIVVSGGQGFQESVTEAYAMEKYLIEHGVEKSKIIKEERATSTNENMRFSKQLLDGILGNDYSVAIVTNNFHIYRGVSIAHIEGLENVTHTHAALQWYNLVPCYLRESLAILKMWILG